LHTFLPTQYLLLLFLAAFCFINWLPIAAMMEAWYCNNTVGGFAAEDAPHGPRRVPSALALLLLSVLTASGGVVLLTTAMHVVSLEDGYSHHAKLPEVPVDRAERCYVAWGRVAVGESAQGAPLLATKSAQLELLHACEQLAAADSPINSEERRDGGPDCFMSAFASWRDENLAPFPVPSDAFASSVADFVRARREYASSVGFEDESLTAVAWVRVLVRAKFAYKGTEVLQLLADPNMMAAYKDEWDAWLAALPGSVREMDDSLPPESDSVLRFGMHGCPKWGVLATEVAFFNGVFTAVIATPVFSMVAIGVFVQSLVISYAALYCLVGMVVTILGLMHVCAIPLGVAEALALSLVIGMSVDYIIHLAHAYKHSLFADRYFKSRAATFVRGSSIGAAAATTLAAVSPLLLARLLPLRNFGMVFLLVTTVSLAFAVCFLTLLMVVGPLRTRSGAADDDLRPMPWDASVDPSLASSGWALQVDIGEAYGLHGAGCADVPHDEGRARPRREEEDVEML